MGAQLCEQRLPSFQHQHQGDVERVSAPAGAAGRALGPGGAEAAEPVARAGWSSSIIRDRPRFFCLRTLPTVKLLETWPYRFPKADHVTG
jgi:hypothetical protein